MKRSAFFSTSTFRYTLFGILFGFLFPILGMIVSVLFSRLPFGWAAFIEVQRGQPLLWIIDTTPLFLGLAFGIAGRRADRLLQVRNGLEQTVTERISDLQRVNQELKHEIDVRSNYEIQLKATADELNLISEVARGLSSEQDIEELLPLITHLINDQFGFYHVGIFLLDKAKKFAVLKASNSMEGQQMLERGHRLEVGQVGIVGNVAATGIAHVASEVGEDTLFFNNPNLPETRSEIALPLMVQKQIIGVIDVQSKDSNAFTQARANTLSILADQVAIAIENSRLITETQEALSEAQSLSRQFSPQAWKQVPKEQQIGYLHTIKGDEKLTEPIKWEEAQQAVKSGEMVILSPNQETKCEPALAIPLRVREQTIGVLDIRSTNPNRLWQTEEINIIQTIADRVGLALENARLFEESNNMANRERTVSEITTHLRNTNDPDVMLQTALEELKRALGANDIQIRPYHPTANQNAGQQPDLIKNTTPDPTETA